MLWLEFFSLHKWLEIFICSAFTIIINETSKCNFLLVYICVLIYWIFLLLFFTLIINFLRKYFEIYIVLGYLFYDR